MTDELFFSSLNIVASGCWEWTAYTMPKPGFPYGRLRVGAKKVLAHRHAYQLRKGEIPDGLFVLHSCDNPKCCNPAHLFLGTQLDNIKDRDSKGRCKAKFPISRGEKSGSTHLKDADVLDIRRRYADGNETTVSLGIEYKMHHSCISRIVNRKTWKHI